MYKDEGLIAEAKQTFKKGLEHSPANRYLVEFLDELNK